MRKMWKPANLAEIDASDFKYEIHSRVDPGNPNQDDFIACRICGWGPKYHTTGDDGINCPDMEDPGEPTP